VSVSKYLHWYLLFVVYHLLATMLLLIIGSLIFIMYTTTTSALAARLVNGWLVGLDGFQIAQVFRNQLYCTYTCHIHYSMYGVRTQKLMMETEARSLW
jgi:hypothetical protein